MRISERISPASSNTREIHNQNVGGIDFSVISFVSEPLHPVNKKKAIVKITGWSMGPDTPAEKRLCEALAQSSGSPVIAIKARADKSVRGNLPRSAEAIRRTIIPILEKRGIENLTVMGHSEGGKQAIALTALLQSKNPGIANGLVLLDSVGLSDKDDTKFLTSFLGDGLNTALAALKKYFIPNAIYGASAGLGIVREFARDPLGYIPRTGREIRAMTKGSPYRGEICVPVVIISGQNDVLSNPTMDDLAAFTNTEVFKMPADKWTWHDMPFVDTEAVIDGLVFLDDLNQQMQVQTAV